MSTDISTLSPLHPDEGNTMLGIYEDPRQPDRIIKMVDPLNDGYFAYAQWLLSNQSRSPHFLKVYAIEILDNHRALVTVERLQNHHDLDHDAVIYLGCILADYGTYNVPAPDPLLVEATTILYQELAPYWTPDLHQGNFMSREDGTVVINDPFHRRKPRL